MTTYGILTVSDSCIAKKQQDLAGPKLQDAVKNIFPNFSLTFWDVVEDDKEKIIKTLQAWIEGNCNLIFTVGGTGFSPRDVTPEATRCVIEREAPGVTYAMLSKSLEFTPYAMLSRAVCGIRNNSIVINLPGSAKAAVECFSVIQQCLPHAVALLLDQKRDVVKDHTVIQDRSSPSKVRTGNVSERPRHSTYRLVEVSEAFDLLTSEGIISPVTVETPINKALNYVLAEDVFSLEPHPPFDASIKDGYAVITADGAGSRLIRSTVVAGDYPRNILLKQGEAIRINTGAPIPEGADAVVQVEDTTVLEAENGDEIRINIAKSPVLGQDIRKTGSDISENTMVLRQGVRLKAPHIGILAALGKSTVKLYESPRVALFSTGNELVEHHKKPKPGQIRDSNRLSLMNLLMEHDYRCNDYGIIVDDPNSIKAAISTALRDNDFLITTGGVSMGEHDYIKRVLVEDFDATIHFGRINMKPGKPTTFATLNFQDKKKVFFGLPGNPVSACVTCLLFVIPLFRQVERENSWQWPIIPYEVSTSKKNVDPRPEYSRVVVSFKNGKIEATSNGGQMSSRLNSLVGANGLLLYPGSMNPGETYPSNIVLIDNLLT